MYTCTDCGGSSSRLPFGGQPTHPRPSSPLWRSNVCSHRITDIYLSLRLIGVPVCLLSTIVVKALYGLKSSGAMWHHQLTDNLRNVGYRPTQADYDCWIQDVGDHYEYVAVIY
jgi:hypothetical protein